MAKTETPIMPKPGEVWSDAETRLKTQVTFLAKIEQVWEPNGHGYPGQVAYRRAGGGPLVNIRLQSFLWRFRRIESKPTGPFG